MMLIDEVFAEWLDKAAHSMHLCKYYKDDECMDEFVPKDFDCLRSLMKTFEESCGKFTDYSRRFIKYFVRECE